MVVSEEFDTREIDWTRAKLRASVLWLIAKAYHNKVPSDLREPCYQDHGDERLKPQIIHALANAELYCLALANIYADPNYHQLNHHAILQLLMRKGVELIEPPDIMLTETVLVQTAPIKIGAHMAVIEGIMNLYIKEVLIPEKVLDVIKRFTNVNSASEMPSDPEDAALLWLNKSTLKMKHRIEEEMGASHSPDSPNQRAERPRVPPIPAIHDLSELSSGCSLVALISFYCPTSIYWQDLRLSDSMSLSDSIYNILLLHEFCEQYLPQDVFFLTLDDFLYMDTSLRLNFLALIADLLYLFEIRPAKCVTRPGVPAPPSTPPPTTPVFNGGSQKDTTPNNPLHHTKSRMFHQSPSPIPDLRSDYPTPPQRTVSPQQSNGNIKPAGKPSSSASPCPPSAGRRHTDVTSFGPSTGLRRTRSAHMSERPSRAVAPEVSQRLPSPKSERPSPIMSPDSSLHSLNAYPSTPAAGFRLLDSPTLHKSPIRSDVEFRLHPEALSPLRDFSDPSPLPANFSQQPTNNEGTNNNNRFTSFADMCKNRPQAAPALNIIYSQNQQPIPSNRFAPPPPPPVPQPTPPLPQPPPQLENLPDQTTVNSQMKDIKHKLEERKNLIEMGKKCLQTLMEEKQHKVGRAAYLQAVGNKPQSPDPSSDTEEKVQLETTIQQINTSLSNLQADYEQLSTERDQMQRIINQYVPAALEQPPPLPQSLPPSLPTPQPPPPQQQQQTSHHPQHPPTSWPEPLQGPPQQFYLHSGRDAMGQVSKWRPPEQYPVFSTDGAETYHRQQWGPPTMMPFIDSPASQYPPGGYMHWSPYPGGGFSLHGPEPNRGYPPHPSNNSFPISSQPFYNQPPPASMNNYYAPGPQHPPSISSLRPAEVEEVETDDASSGKDVPDRVEAEELTRPGSLLLSSSPPPHKPVFGKTFRVHKPKVLSPGSSPSQVTPTSALTPNEPYCGGSDSNLDTPSEDKGFYVSLDDGGDLPKKPKPKLKPKQIKARQQQRKMSDSRSKSPSPFQRHQSPSSPPPYRHKPLSPERRSPSPPPENSQSPTRTFTRKKELPEEGVGFMVGADLVKPDPNAEIEMTRKKEMIMVMSLRRRAEQEAKRAYKEQENAHIKENERMKKETLERKKYEEKMRRQQILEQYRHKKTQQQELDPDSISSKDTSRTIIRPKSRSGSRPRPKTIHLGNSSQSVLDSQLNLSRGYADLDSASVQSLDLPYPPRRHPSSPSSLPANLLRGGRGTGPPSDGASDTTSTTSSLLALDYTGPKLFVKPSAKSNRGIITNAINTVLAGAVNADTKRKVLQDIQSSSSKHFLILFRDAGLQFRALYSYNPETEEVFKLYGVGPKMINDKMMDRFYKYNSGGKSFTQIQTKHLTVTIDAITIQNTLWSGKKAPPPLRRDLL